MLTHTRHRAFALVALVSLGGSCLLAGCASYFQTTYKPATAGHGSLIAPPATPEFRWSLDPDRDGRRLAEQGYVLIGTSRRDYTTDLRFAGEHALAQGKRVGAAVVLLYVHGAYVNDDPGCDYGTPNMSCDLAFAHPIGAFFASYWGKASPAGT